MADGDYEWFITLAELQHVTSAAEQLHVAQPTLTRMLARLEQRMGVSLFDRHGRRLALNTYGRIFYEHARRAQLELDAAEGLLGARERLVDIRPLYSVVGDEADQRAAHADA